MKLLQAIQTTLLNYDKTQLINNLGYHATQKGFIMLDKLLACGNLNEWLETSHYDLVYTSEEFLKALCGELGIEKSFYEDEINKAKRFNIQIDRLNRSYIVVNTDFKRESQPIFSLAACEYFRNLRFAHTAELVDKTLDDIMAVVSQMIKEHYTDTEGKLPLWGVIKNYILHIYDKTYLFDTNGVLIETNPQISENKAISSI